MINDNLEMAKIEMDIERLENELLPEDFDLMQLRDTDNTIHWTLKALVVYMEDLQKAGIWADELPEAVELLTMNLETNINIMVYETTGFDACDFADNKDITEEEKNDYSKLTMLIDVVQMATIGGLSIQEAGFILSNIDMLDITKLRSMVDKIEEETEWLPLGRTRDEIDTFRNQSN